MRRSPIAKVQPQRLTGRAGRQVHQAGAKATLVGTGAVRGLLFPAGALTMVAQGQSQAGNAKSWRQSGGQRPGTGKTPGRQQGIDKMARSGMAIAPNAWLCGQLARKASNPSAGGSFWVWPSGAPTTLLAMHSHRTRTKAKVCPAKITRRIGWSAAGIASGLLARLNGGAKLDEGAKSWAQVSQPERGKPPLSDQVAKLNR